MKKVGLLLLVTLVCFSCVNPSAFAATSCKLYIQKLPIELADYYYNHRDIYTKVRITDVKYNFEKSSSGIKLEMSFSGEKTYDYEGKDGNSICVIQWKLYDEDGYVVDSSSTYTDSMKVGEKFKNLSVSSFSLEPGTYTLKFSNITQGSPSSIVPASTAIPDDSESYFPELCKLNIPALPIELADYYYNHRDIYTKVRITDVKYNFEKSSSGIKLEMSFSGEKTYDYEGKDGNSICVIQWKLYDEDGYVVDSSSTYTDSMKVGEKFKNCSTRVFSLKTGSYTLVFTHPTSTPLPTPAHTIEPGAKGYLGVWKPSAVWDRNANNFYDTGIYSSLLITINDNHTIQIKMNGKETGDGTWAYKSNRFYVDNEPSFLYMSSDGYLLVDIGDNYYVVMSHDGKPIVTVTPTAAPTPAPTPKPTEKPIIYGDINNDGSVDGRDLLRLARYMAGDSVSVDMAAADMNGDGNVDGRDVLRLAKQLAGN